jgi:ribosomal protein S12 methylthiotransferase
MAAQVPEKTKQKRRQRAMAEQLKVSRAVSQGFVGRKIKVLVERSATDRDLKNANVSSWEHGLMRGAGGVSEFKGRYLVARGEADAPDIDGRVYIAGSKLPEGEFAWVKVIGHTDYDLIAEPV